MRFLHTSDWQLGLSRYYLDQDARARYAADRFEAIRRLGELAEREGAAFVVVAGDVFDKNLVDRRTLLRGLDVMKAAAVPFLLLPGNHDPLDAASVYRSATFVQECPANVQVLGDDEPVRLSADVEVVGAPWPHKEPRRDLVAARAAALEPCSGRLRVMVGHGAVDSLSPDADDPARIRLDDVRRALETRLYDFLALGDRHSATRVEDAVWYSGTPEATDFNEERPGRVLRVELGGGPPRVEELEVGRWRFLRLAVDLAGEEDLERLQAELDAVDDPSRTVLRLTLEGHLPLHARVHLDRLLEAAGERFAAVDRTGKRSLTLIPDEIDRDALDLGGWAATAFEELLAEAGGGAAEGASPGAEAVGEGETGAADGGAEDAGAGEGTAGDDEAEDASAEAGAPEAGAAEDGADPEAAGAAEPAPDDRSRVAADALALLYRLAGDLEAGRPPAPEPQTPGADPDPGAA